MSKKSEASKLAARDLQALLEPAELAMAQFEPPSALSIPPDDNMEPPTPPDLSRIQEEVAQKNALELSKVLFTFIHDLSAEIANSEMDKRLSNFQQTVVEAVAGTSTSITTITNSYVTNSYVSNSYYTYTSGVILNNNTGGTIAQGVPVYISGTLGIAPSRANNTNTAIVFGITTESITNGSSGSVATRDAVWIPGAAQSGSWVAGDTIYLSDITAGILTNVRPSASGTFVLEIGQLTNTVPAGSSSLLYIMKTARILN